jgi:hypothetical protein
MKTRTKYIRINSVEYVTRELYARMDADGDDRVVRVEPITVKRIKELGLREFTAAWYDEERYETWLRETFHGKDFTARVLTGGPRNTEFFIKLLDPERANDPLLTIYACNIYGAKTWYPETASVYYDVDQEITVRGNVIGRELFLMGITPGTLNVEQWDRIKNKNLAFRCDDNGNAVTGLFTTETKHE